MHKLMIVDDSNLIRNRIQREYDSQQFQLVGTAENGSTALELFDRLKPDVVTMDLTMPQIDGIECIEHLIAKSPDVRILVVSAINDKATGMEALEKGAMGFITKPFSGNDLKAALQELVED